MSAYSHRDRRAHRDVDRAFASVTGISLALIVVALVVPLPLVGVVSVVGLAALGAVYLGWADRMLDRYVTDLRAAREDRLTDGFVRAEIATPVGLDREPGAPPSPSPHSRRRTRGSRESDRSSEGERGPGQP